MALPTGNRKYEIQHMWEKHHKIARLIALGMSNVDIAATIGCTPQNVSDIRNSPLIQSKVNDLRNILDAEAMAVAKRIESGTPMALQVLEDIISGAAEGATVSLKARVAQDWLDRAGFAPVHKIETESRGTLTIEEITSLRNRGQSIKEMARRDGLIVDADYSVEK